MSDSVTVERATNGWRCSLQAEGLRAHIHLADANGGLAVTEVTISSEAGEGIAASALTRAPYARWIRAAKDEVHRQRPRGRLRRASDLYVAPFLEDGRGKAGRSDEDFANLAWLYVLRGESSRSLARDLATQHGGSVQTWRNRLTKAKRFTCMTEAVDEDGRVQERLALTNEAMRLIFGKDYASHFEVEAMRDRELEGAMRFIQIHEAPRSSAERAVAQLEKRMHGAATIERRLQAAHRVVDAYEQRRPL